MKVLERAGCDVAAKDVYGCTGEDIPAWHLIVAVQAGASDLSAIAASDMEDCDICWTAFHYECKNENPDCVEALVQAGCDVTIQCDDGLTGKELAEECGRTEVVNCLTRMAKAAKNKKKRDRKRRQQIKAKQAAAVEQSNVAEPIKAELKLEPEPEPEPTDLAEPEAEITVLLLPDPVTAVEPS